MNRSAFLLLFILLTACRQDIPECPCKQIPEEQIRQDSSIRSKEFYAGLNAEIEAQIKLVQNEDKLDLAFKNMSELRSAYFTKLGFSHDEVNQYNLIVNQLCNVWRNMHASQNDENTRNICRQQYLEGLEALQKFIRNISAAKPPSLTLNSFLTKSKIEIATVQWELERTEELNARTDLEGVIAQIQYLQNLATRDSSKVEFCGRKLETIMLTYKNYRP